MEIIIQYFNNDSMKKKKILEIQLSTIQSIFHLNDIDNLDTAGFNKKLHYYNARS